MKRSESYQKPQMDSLIKARLQWLGHMARVTEERLVRRIAWKTIGYKKERKVMDGGGKKRMTKLWA